MLHEPAAWIHATLLSTAGITAKLDDEFLKQHKIPAAKLQKVSDAYEDLLSSLRKSSISSV